MFWYLGDDISSITSIIQTFLNHFFLTNISDERIILLREEQFVLYGIEKMDIYSIIEKARKTGKVEKGTNEVTKAIERGTAKLVVYAADVNPKEIVHHIPLLCREKGIKCREVDSRHKLGIAVGISVPASSVAVIVSGDAEKDIDSLK